MRTHLFVLLAACGTLVMATSAEPALAKKRQSFHCSGAGVFSPTNVGTSQGGNAGIIVGDGSGISQYLGEGTDFTIGGQSVGSGWNGHKGTVVSRTTGILRRSDNTVHWPARSGKHHVLSSEQGELHFKYVGAFHFALSTGALTGDALFIVVGGTDRFEHARGIVRVHVAVPFPILELPPPGVSPALPFTYDFNGFVILDD